MPHCPLCRRTVDALEFHHWDYDHDVGIELCRKCHNAVHGGEDGRVAIQQNRAEYYGVDHWHVAAIGNLVERDISYLAESEFLIDENTDFDEYWSRLRDRYNLPPEDQIRALEMVKNEASGTFRYAQHDWLTQGRYL